MATKPESADASALVRLSGAPYLNDASSKPPPAPVDRMLGGVGWRMAIAGFGLAMTAALSALWIDERVQRVLSAQIATVLRVTLDTAVAGVLPQLEAAERGVAAAATDARLRAGIECLLSEPPAGACPELSGLVHPYLRQGGFAGFGLADREGRIRAGTPARDGLERLPEGLTERLFERTVGVLVEGMNLPGGEPVLSMALPLSIDGPASTAALVFWLPMSSWTQPMAAARIGTLGETYAFDRRGRLLSSSRFEPQLRREGWLPPAALSAALALELRDPGVAPSGKAPPPADRLKLPLTRAVEAAVSGASAVEIVPYRNYRGVPVVGAYRFFPRFELGIVTEIDEAMAFETLSTLQMMLKWLVGALLLSALALIGVAWISSRLRRRAQTAERLVARFGQYRIVRKIGEGGMGAVYLASHEMLRRPAAIKLLRPDRASPEAIARFEREVRVTATLKHPNTVAVYDYGRTERGDLFYVMEYLEGLDLQNLVQRFGAMPSARVLHYLRQLCGSLAEAHAARLVHRDIKPANLLACRVGGVPDTLKVVDFGVAKTLTGEMLGLTNDRVVLGTPEYMAPELFESADRASAQSDLYSVGAVGYFLLTGQTVFEARSLTELSLAQLTRTPEPPSAKLSEPADPALESAIMACLAKRREQRPVSARSLLSLLERSKLTGAWTVTDAEAWWNAHAGELEEVRASREPASPSPEYTRIRPVARA